MTHDNKDTSYRFFLDESGDHGLSFVDDNFPIFLLLGCLFEAGEYKRVAKEFHSLKLEYFHSDQVILHSREIRKCEGAFQVLFDLDLKRRFYERLNAILGDAQYTIIAVAIDKKKHIEKYGKGAHNPYSICLSFIMERLVFCVEGAGRAERVAIDIEKRGKKEDAELLAHYNSILDRGTLHVSPARFKERIADFQMKSKRDNEIGLQIADLCAYPVARHVLNAQEPYVPYQVIEKKLRRGANGLIEGYGLKVFP